MASAAIPKATARNCSPTANGFAILLDCDGALDEVLEGPEDEALVERALLIEPEAWVELELPEVMVAFPARGVDVVLTTLLADVVCTGTVALLLVLNVLTMTAVVLDTDEPTVVA